MLSQSCSAAVRLARRMLRVLRPSPVHKPVHFLHIGKTGGTAIRVALEPVVARRGIHYHHHRVSLKDIPAGEQVFCFLRDPIQRFTSGFFSRLRCGRFGHMPHKPAEAEAFARFSLPNELALALSAADDEVRQAAEQAMGGIGHINRSLWYWLGSEEYLLSRLDDILFIGRQETLDQDFEILKRILNVPQELALPRDPVGAHKTPSNLDRRLDPIAVANLQRWFARDYDLLRFWEQLPPEKTSYRPSSDSKGQAA